MAAITIGHNNLATINPTNGFLPYNDNNIFQDSILQQTSPERLTGKTGTTENGVLIDYPNYIYKFGDFGNTLWGTTIVINDVARKIELLGTNLTSGTSGGASGQHLSITINGTGYKLQLLNP